VTSATIKIGTLADPGAEADPGLEHEFFDVADAFSKWCNAAGGINGRKIVIAKHDAKLFNGAQAVLSACQSDFMLVGGGNAIDAADVQPRLACKLGQIPAYTVSPQATAASLQVTPSPNIANEIQIGQVLRLGATYPETQQHLGIGSSSLASLATQGQDVKTAYEAAGYHVTVLQAKPALIDNYRPYMEQLRTTGSKALYEIVGLNINAEVTAMNDVGFAPSYLLLSTPNYAPSTVAAAKKTKFPPTYVGLAHLPFNFVSPATTDIKNIMSAQFANPEYTDFTALAFNAWTLWAKSAMACGANLTQQCVLDKSGAITNWTAGGFYAPTTLAPGHQHYSDCILLIRLTTNGWVYDRAATKPNQGAYNCSEANVGKV
jgi:hypothetical protein